MQASAMHIHTFGFGEDNCETCGMPFCETHGDETVSMGAADSAPKDHSEKRTSHMQDGAN